MSRGVRVNWICSYCDKEFLVPQWKEKYRGERTFCSRPCKHSAGASAESKEKNRKRHIGLMTGERHPQWKGGLPKCPTCNKELSSRLASFCRKHAPFIMTEERRVKMRENQRKNWLGKKFTDDHRRNLSKSHIGKGVPHPAMLGNIPWNKNRVGVMPTPWNKGLSWSDEMKKKMSIARKGKMVGENHPMWGRKRPEITGKNNHNWRGGITSENEKLRKSTRYILWRKSILERDNYTCQICKKRGGKLQADHIKPFCAFPEFRFDIKNGRTLCVPCHLRTETWGGKALSFIQ